MYNKICLIGYLTKDPELRYISSGTAILNFTIAVNTRYTSNGEQKEEVLFMDNVLFGKVAESINQYMTKGTLVLIDGRLQKQEWDSDGGKRFKYQVIVNTIKLLSKGSGAKAQTETKPVDDELESF